MDWPDRRVPAEVGRLSALRKLSFHNKQLTSQPMEIGQLTSLEWLNLNYNWPVGHRNNMLTSVPAEKRELGAAGSYVTLENNVTVDE